MSNFDSFIIRMSILAVEDSQVYQYELRDALGSDYHLTVAGSAEEAETLLADPELPLPDFILLDLVLPGKDGLTLLADIRRNSRTRAIPVIVVSTLSHMEQKRTAFNLEAADFITKPYDAEEIRLRIKTHSQAAMAQKWLSVQNELLEARVQAQVQEIIRTRDAVISSMAIMAEARDNETGKHILRTKYYVKNLIETMLTNPDLAKELEGMDIGLIAQSAPLHDVGKVGIPDAILNKPGPLTPDEWKIIKTHPFIGHDILIKAEKTSGTSVLLRHARRIALYHHEKWDGSGYPEGLKGKNIPIEARVMAVADVFDALISKRVYKEAWPLERVIQEMEAGRGTHFDPDIMDAFHDCHTILHDFAMEHVDTD